MKNNCKIFFFIDVNGSFLFINCDFLLSFEVLGFIRIIILLFFINDIIV